MQSYFGYSPLVAAAEIEIEADDVVYLEELYTPVQNLLSIGTS